MTDAQLRALVVDCLRLWEVKGEVIASQTGLVIETAGGVFTLARADPALVPVRWFYQTPEREAAGRPPRAVPSIAALLSALRNAMGGTGGDRLTVGGA